MSHRDDAAAALQRHIVQFIDARYEASYRDHCKEAYAEEVSQSDLSDDTFEKINEFATELFVDTCKGVYDAVRGDVHAKIQKDVGSLVQDLLTEEEAEEFLTFIKSPTGAKILRNLDLVREAYAGGLNRLIVETVAVWNSPEIQEILDEYIEMVEGEVDEANDAEDSDDDFVNG